MYVFYQIFFQSVYQLVQSLYFYPFTMFICAIQAMWNKSSAENIKINDHNYNISSIL